MNTIPFIGFVGFIAGGAAMHYKMSKDKMPQSQDTLQSYSKSEQERQDRSKNSARKVSGGIDPFEPQKKHQGRKRNKGSKKKL